MKIGVISDSHGFIHPDALDIFRTHQVEHIIHGGDIGGAGVDGYKVIKALEGIAPVTAVNGNHDHLDDNMVYPDHRTLRVKGKSILITHQFFSGAWNHIPWLSESDLGKMLARNVDAVVYGHTHMAENENRNGVLCFNPGYSGDEQDEPFYSVGILTVSDNGITGEHFPLRKFVALAEPLLRMKGLAYAFD